MSIVLWLASAAAGWVTPEPDSGYPELYVPAPLVMAWGEFPPAIRGPEGELVATLDAVNGLVRFNAVQKPKKNALFVGAWWARRAEELGCAPINSISACRYRFSGGGQAAELIEYQGGPAGWATGLMVYEGVGPQDAVQRMIASVRRGGSIVAGPGDEAEASTVASPADHDADGVANEADACPAEAEDVDGFADADGCPDPVHSEVDRPACDAGEVEACHRLVDALREEGRHAEAGRVMRDRCEASGETAALCVDAIDETARAGDIPGALALAQRLCGAGREDACWSVDWLNEQLIEWEHARARSPAHLPLATLDRKVPGPCGARMSSVGGPPGEDPFAVWTQTWSADGRVATREENNGSTSIRRHDHAGHEIELRYVDPDGDAVTRTTRDAAGRPIEQVSEGGWRPSTTRWTRDERGRVLRSVETYPSGEEPTVTEITWTDDTHGVEVSSGPYGERYELTVDEQGREVRRARGPEGEPIDWTETTWGPHGKVEERSYFDGALRSRVVWTWDAHGNLLEHQRFPAWVLEDEGEEPFPELWIRYDYGCW